MFIRSGLHPTYTAGPNQPIAPDTGLRNALRLSS